MENKRVDYVIRFTNGKMFWMNGGSFTNDLIKATMFGDRYAAHMQLKELGYPEEEACVAKVTKNGTVKDRRKY